MPRPPRTLPRRAAWTLLLLATVLLATAVLAVEPLRAQPIGDDRFTMQLRGVPLPQALGQLVSATHISLVYDTELVGPERVYCDLRDATPEVLLRCILSRTSLDYYRTSAGTYVLIEAAAQPDRRGRLVGLVVDAQTGEPLPYASVVLPDAGVAGVANEAGLFAFTDLLTGTHRLAVTYVGYQPAVDSVVVVARTTSRPRIPLRASPITASPVVVDGLHPRLPSQTLGLGRVDALDRAAPSGHAGTADVLHATASLLGVALHEPMADLHIQGGEPGEHLIELDGVPVRNPVTLGRLLGAFSPLAVGHVTVHKAGFGVRHGSLTSGLVSVRHGLAPSLDRYATVQADPTSLNARLHRRVDLGQGRRLTGMVAGRTSLWSVYHDPSLRQLLRRWHQVDIPLLTTRTTPSATPTPAGLQSLDDLAFSDLHAAFRLHLSPAHTLYASAYRGSNDLAASLLSEPGGPDKEGQDEEGERADPAADRYHWRNWTAQLTHTWIASPRALWVLQGYASRQSLGHGYAMGEFAAYGPSDNRAYPPGAGTQNTYAPGADAPSAAPSTDVGPPSPYEGNKVREAGLRAELEYGLAARHRLHAQVEARRLDGWAQVDELTLPLTYRRTGWTAAASLVDELSISARTTLEAGARLTYVPAWAVIYGEPRLALRHDGTHPVLGSYAMRLAGGLYRQFVHQFDVSSAGPTAIVPTTRFWLPVDASVAPSRAYHLAAEATATPHPSWTVDLESYLKLQPHLLTVDYATLATTTEPVDEAPHQDAFLAGTSGHAYGAGLRLAYETPARGATVSYSLGRARRRYPGRFGGRLVPVPWEQPHRLTLGARQRLAGFLEARARWHGVWGRSWAYRQPYYDYLSMADPPEDEAMVLPAFDRPGDDRLAPLYRLDLGLTFEQRWGDVATAFHVDLTNVLNRTNAFDWSLGPDGRDPIVRTLPSRRLLFALRVSY